MRRKKHVIAAAIIAIAVPLAIILALTAGSAPPVIELRAQPLEVFPLGSAQIVCTVSAPEGAVLSYEWEASGGEIYAQGATATWTAPEAEGPYTITVTVADSRGHEVRDHVLVTARANRPPVIHSLTADADWTAPSGSLQLVCDAEDPDGHQLSYNWSASGGHSDGKGPEVLWIAPQETGIYEITVVVTDDYGGSVTSTLTVSVMPDQPPVIEALLVSAGHKYLRQLVSGERYQVGEGRTFDIECIASHPYGIALTYEWECDTGEISDGSEDGSLIKWTAPYVRGFTSVTVTVSDLAGNMARQSVTLEVVSCSRFG